MFSATVLVLGLLSLGGARAEPSLEDCLRAGSVGCVRDYVSRSLRYFLGEDSAGFLEGVLLNRADWSEGSVSAGGSAQTSQQREVLPESASSGDLGVDKVADTGAAVEGRGKKMKKILEYLIALKMLYFIWGMVGYVMVALVAKTALLKSSLALGLAGLFLLKKLLLHSYHHVLSRHGAGVHHEAPAVTNYGPAHGEAHGASLAYSAHHPEGR